MIRQVADRAGGWRGAFGNAARRAQGSRSRKGPQRRRTAGESLIHSLAGPQPPRKKGTTMEKKDLKKFLAGLSVAGLLSLGGVTVPGAHAGSG